MEKRLKKIWEVLPAIGCGVQVVVAADKTVTSGRSMEYATSTGESIGYVQAGDVLNEENCEKTKIGFTGFYSNIGLKILGKEIGVRMFSDLVNDEGLGASTLWLPRVTKFDTSLTKPKNGIPALTLTQLVASSCKNNQDVRKLLEGKQVYLPNASLEQYATVRLVTVDRAGTTLVTEFHDVDGKPGTPVFFDSNGTVTNYPSYSWYQTYEQIGCNYQMFDDTENVIAGLTSFPAGCGSNFAGMSADNTPPARFTRLYSNHRLAVDYERPKNGDEAFNLLSNLFGLVHIQKGTTASKTATGKHLDSTLWIRLFNHKTGQLEVKRPHKGRNWEVIKAPVIKLTPDLVECSFFDDEPEALGAM
ncbi:MAG: linear amide C-N hydrolase [Burkholderiales bacterium]|nr:linear amide C-N hydrolase [Burkholderiales bacterium]